MIFRQIIGCFFLIASIILWPVKLNGQLDQPGDSLGFFILLEKSKEYQKSDTDSALIFADSALELSNQLNSNYLKALAEDQKSILERAKGKWEEAIYLLNDAITLEEEFGWYEQSGKSHIHLGNLYKNEGEVQERNSHFNMADESYRLALTSYRKALNAFLITHDSVWIGRSYSNIGVAHYKLYQDSLALQNYKKAAAIFKKQKLTQFIPVISTNIGLIYQNNGNMDSAAYYYSSARQAFKAKTDIRNWINSDINLAGVYDSIKFQNALGLLKEADSLAKASNNKLQQLYIQEYLYQMYSRKHDYKNALKHLEKYRVINDSILNKKFKSEELQVRYQTAMQKELLERQKSKNLEQQLMLTQSNAEKVKLRFWIYTILFILLIATGFYIWRQRLGNILQQQKEQLYRQEIKELERSKKLEATTAMLAGQEKERVRVAEELHDSLGSTLAAARIQFEVAMTKTGKERTSRLTKAHDLLDKAINDTRSISHNLISAVLVNLGLMAALKDLKESMAVIGHLQIEIYANKIPRLKEDIELNLYRICQELISNIIKHTSANHILIKLSFIKNRLTLIVVDNGEGFDPAKISKGLGLYNIERRVSAINGDLTIQSQPGEGAQFKIQVLLADEAIKDFPS